MVPTRRRGIERAVGVLEHHLRRPRANASARAARGASMSSPSKRYVPTAHRLQPQQRAAERRFAAAGFADQANGFACRDSKRNTGPPRAAGRPACVKVTCRSSTTSRLISGRRSETGDRVTRARHRAAAVASAPGSGSKAREQARGEQAAGAGASGERRHAARNIGERGAQRPRPAMRRRRQQAARIRVQRARGRVCAAGAVFHLHAGVHHHHALRDLAPPRARSWVM